MYLRDYETTLGDGEPPIPFSFSPECADMAKAKNLLKQMRVAIVGGGFGGLMAAKWLGQHGFDVTVFEARSEVGGRVLSNTTFVKGRITEAGAELIGSFHTTWLELAREYGLSMISRMNSELYEQARLSVKLKLGGKELSMDEFVQLEKAMRKRVLIPMAHDASQISDPSQPWLESSLNVEDQKSVGFALQNRYNIRPDEPLWKMLEHKLVNDEVAPLDKMNHLGLLCKVRAGQRLKFKFEDPDDKITPLMRYWDELEIFRCAEGCQMLAKKIVEDIQSKAFQKRFGGKATVLVSTAVTNIDLSQSKKPGVMLSFKKVKDQQHETLAGGAATTSHYDYVIFAIPPNRWGTVTFTPENWHPKNKNEVGVMGMDDAVKFFSDVKERFWIKRAAAPYGGSSEIGQVWEGTDNQTRVSVGALLFPNGRRVELKQGVVLSVFAGPILPGAKAPDPGRIKAGLKDLYPDYPSNVQNTLFSNWPEEPFIHTGYASPRLGEIFKIVPKLNQPFHNLLFFAGEHTRMDFFGYMEGALRSGERAAKLLMQQLCPHEASQTKVARAG